MAALMKRELDYVERRKVLMTLPIATFFHVPSLTVAEKEERGRRSASPSPSPTDGKSKYIVILTVCIDCCS